MRWDASAATHHHDRVVEYRPVVWDATMVAPRADRDVTVVVRVTYRTLEQICEDLFAVSVSRADPPTN